MWQGHQPGGHLVIRNFLARKAGNQEINFLTGVFPTIAFFSDEIDRAHQDEMELRD